ncbi:MAG: GPW/gp25 family protein [Caldilineaceae bacterium]
MKNPIIGRGWGFPPQINRHGGIALTTEETDIQQAIRIILTTSPGERVMRPTFGSRLHELVFAPINTETLTLARHYVEEALTMWEPRIDLVNVDIDWDNHSNDGLLLITLDYEIKSTHDRRSLVYPFYLIPEE